MPNSTAGSFRPSPNATTTRFLPSPCHATPHSTAKAFSVSSPITSNCKVTGPNSRLFPLPPNFQVFPSPAPDFSNYQFSASSPIEELGSIRSAPCPLAAAPFFSSPPDLSQSASSFQTSGTKCVDALNWNHSRMFFRSRLRHQDNARKLSVLVNPPKPSPRLP